MAKRKTSPTSDSELSVAKILVGGHTDVAGVTGLPSSQDDMGVDPEDKGQPRSTASKAVAQLLKMRMGFRKLTGPEKKNLLIAFARTNRVAYGQAYDLVRVLNRVKVTFTNEEDVFRKIEHIQVCEVKSTARKLDKDFNKYFFAITTAELLTAQSLRSQYLFVFYNTTTKGRPLCLSLKEVLERAKNFYPTWSITLESPSARGSQPAAVSAAKAVKKPTRRTASPKKTTQKIPAIPKGAAPKPKARSVPR